MYFRLLLLLPGEAATASSPAFGFASAGILPRRLLPLLMAVDDSYTRATPAAKIGPANLTSIVVFLPGPTIAIGSPG